MAARLIIGRAGTGKTALCGREIRAAMARDPLGPPLLWIVPEQGTFAAERLLLTAQDAGAGACRGTFRAQVLSFRRLAMIIAREVGLFARRADGAATEADDDGMAKPMDEIARALLLEETVRQHRSQLMVFANVADRPGFLQKLDATLRELRQHGHTGATLRALLQGAGKERFDAVGRRKLQDLALLLDAWSQGMEAADAWDFEQLMHQAALKVGAAPLIAGTPSAGEGGATEGKARIWVDAFSTFSALELRMLAGLALAAQELTITLLADPDSPALRSLRQMRGPADEWGLFARTERLHRRLIDTFRRHQATIGPTVALRQTHRFIHPLIARIEAEALDEAPTAEPLAQASLFDAAVAGPDGAVADGHAAAGGGVEIWEASDPETEVRVAAQAIRKLVLGPTTGALRYRQIAVIVPELDESAGHGGYQDAIRRIFTQHQIPHFIDQRRRMAHHPLVELLKSSVAFVSSRFGRDDLLLLLKTQLAGIAEEEVALLENYVIEHGITGGYGPEAWSQAWTWLAPNQEDEANVPETARRRLTHVNAIRRQIWAVLEPFAQALAGSPAAAAPQDASRFPQALRHLLDALAAEKRLQQWMDAARQAHDAELAQVHEQVWREVDHLLTLLETLLAGRPRSLAEFERLLSTALENLTLGLIPPTVDQVIVSGVTRARIPEMDTVFILGAVEGQFPKVVPEDPILSDAQREAFNACAADPIGEGSDRQLLEMPFFDYVALTRARRQMIVSYPLADRQGKALACSRHVVRLRELLAGPIVEHRFDAATDLGRVATVENLLSAVTTWVRSLRRGGRLDPAAGDLMPAVYNYLVTAPAADMAAARRIICDSGHGGRPAPQLSPELAERFYPPGTRLRLSVSQLETFAACPLHYFLQYTLALRLRQEFTLDQLSLGQLLHRILERVYRRIIAGEIAWPECPPTALRDLLHAQTDAAIDELHGEIARRTPGYEKTRARIKRHLGIMLEADRRRALAGDLRPAAVEMTFGHDPAAAGQPSTDRHGRILSLPVLALPLPRHTLHLNGKIDRMDEAAAAEMPGRPAAVIDYKSSAAKVLELFRVHAGLALQLPLYALVAQELAGRHALAALYMPLGVRHESADTKDDGPPPDTDAYYQKFKPRGLVDADEAWRLDRALQDHDTGEKRTSAWYSLKFNKDGAIAKTGSDLMEADDFQTVLRFTRRQIARLATELTAGTIAPRPYRHKTEIPCDYCDYVSLCPFDAAHDPFREIAKRPTEELLQRMRDAIASDT
jgi:ATP-dependent helicase/nuclease subunit B